MKLRAVDLFCGAGGASTGLIRACQALGIDVELLAVNHWPTAVQTHEMNHPGVRHLCEAVDRINPRAEVPGGRLHLLLAGPECTHHSTARGGRPVNDQSRASAWHILKWAQELYIDTILIENVPEFRTWGPLGANNRPLKSKKGQTYRAFLDALRSLDYKVEERILNAADYGDPTTRKRLFIMARRGRHRVSWPAPTHSRTGDPTLFGGRKKWRAAREIIDWTVPGRSIFNRKKPLKPATIARILAGLEKFGGPDLRPFLVVLRRNMAGQSLDGPVPTLTTGGHVGLAEPVLVAMEHGGRILDANKPLPTITTAKGGAFGVVEPVLMHTTHGGRVRSVDEPAPTVTGAKRGELAVVEPFILQQQSNGAPRATEDPLPTITCGGKQSLIQAFVLQQQSGGAPRSTDQPLPTIATDGAISVVEPFLVPYHGEKGGAPRVHSVEDPLKTQTTENRFGLAEPFLVPLYGERDGQAPRTHAVDEPVPTIPATGGGKFGVVESFVVTPGGANLRDPRSTAQPLPTVTGTERFAVVEPFITKYNKTATGAYSVDEPVDTISTRDRFGLVQPVIDGYALDIRFRMLQPHELAAATSFPKSYQFHGTREEIVKQIGNAWPGELARALCSEVVQDFRPKRRRAASSAA